MNKEGLLMYGILGEGSYFGDLSVMSDEPNEFAYYVDPYSNKPNEFLQIDGQVFKEVLSSFPLSKSIFERRAQNREDIFHSYKTIALLKIMKCARRISMRILNSKVSNILERMQIMNKLDVKLSLCDNFYYMYKINRKISLVENKKVQKMFK